MKTIIAIDADVLESTPRALPITHARSHIFQGKPYGWRHFRSKGPTRADIAHQGNSEGITWPLVTSGSHGTCTTVLHFVLLLRKKELVKIRACAEHTSGQGRFRTVSVTWLTHFRWKGPNRIDIAPFPVAHAHNILPVPVMWLSSLPVTWLPVAPHCPPQIITELSPYTTNDHEKIVRR